MAYMYLPNVIFGVDFWKEFVSNAALVVTSKLLNDSKKKENYNLNRTEVFYGFKKEQVIVFKYAVNVNTYGHMLSQFCFILCISRCWRRLMIQKGIVQHLNFRSSLF